jgi:hypothetical protein
VIDLPRLRSAERKAQSAERGAGNHLALRASRFALGATGCLALALTGCGGPVAVQGTVTMNGKPLPGAMVVFIPEGGGPEAGAMTDGEGNFHLSGMKTDGSLPGEYRVTVSKKDWPPGVTPPEPTKMTFASVLQKRETVPHRYTVQDKTPLHVQVKRGGANAFRFDLEK